MELREPEPSDWDEILALANASVAHVPDAGPQDEWLANRRRDDSGRLQKHRVAEEEGRLVGYGGIERDVSGRWRMFVVTSPDRLDTVGVPDLIQRGTLVQRPGAPPTS